MTTPGFWEPCCTFGNLCLAKVFTLGLGTLTVGVKNVIVDVVIEVPDPAEAIVADDATTPDVIVVLGRIMDALLLPVMLPEVFTTGTVIDFCSTFGEVCPDDINITFCDCVVVVVIWLRGLLLIVIFMGETPVTGLGVVVV